jgi:hypothetical protein
MSETITHLEKITYPAETFTLYRWAEHAQPTPVEASYSAAKGAVFGKEALVAGNGIHEGKVGQETVSALIESTLALVNEKAATELNVFENIPVANAKIIFSEAAKALQGEQAYNRMLWAATGIVIKEQTETVSEYTRNQRMILHTGVDVSDNGIVLFKYKDKAARTEQLDQLEDALLKSSSQVASWVETNFPIPDFEKTISNPLER